VAKLIDAHRGHLRFYSNLPTVRVIALRPAGQRRIHDTDRVMMAEPSTE